MSWSAPAGPHPGLAGPEKFARLTPDVPDPDSVRFVRAVTGAPPTGEWTPGLRVRDARLHEITPYTLIATFHNGRFPSDNLGHLAALFVDHAPGGVLVLEARSGEVRERLIRYRGGAALSRADDADSFYVVEHRH